MGLTLLDCPVRWHADHQAKRLKEFEAENARLKRLATTSSRTEA